MEWITNNIEVIITIGGLLLSLAGSIFSLILKNKKTGRVLTGISQVVKTFPEYIQMAEKISEEGEVKKTYVMNQAVLLCRSIGIEPTEEQLAYFSAIIDDLVALSKTINIYTNTPKTPEDDDKTGGITTTIRRL